MNGHVLHVCSRDRCVVCEEKVPCCEVCCGMGASLPLCCPGRPLTLDEENDIDKCFIDFIDGYWVVLMPWGNA